MLPFLAVNGVSPDAVNVAIFGGIPVLLAGVGAFYYLIARRADKLEGRFDTLEQKIETVSTDLVKTKTAVAFIRGQLTGTVRQRRERLEVENENGGSGDG